MAYAQIKTMHRGRFWRRLRCAAEDRNQNRLMFLWQPCAPFFIKKRIQDSFHSFRILFGGNQKETVVVQPLLQPLVGSGMFQYVQAALFQSFKLFALHHQQGVVNHMAVEVVTVYEDFCVVSNMYCSYACYSSSCGHWKSFTLYSALNNVDMSDFIASKI